MIKGYDTVGQEIPEFQFVVEAVKSRHVHVLQAVGGKDLDYSSVFLHAVRKLIGKAQFPRAMRSVAVEDRRLCLVEDRQRVLRMRFLVCCPYLLFTLQTAEPEHFLEYAQRAALLNRDKREEANRVARKVEYIELTAEYDFQQQFMEAMQIPHTKDDCPHLEGIVPAEVLHQKLWVCTRVEGLPVVFRGFPARGFTADKVVNSKDERQNSR